MTDKPALNQPQEDAVVRVHSVEKRSTPVIVNQRRVDVPHNQDFPLAGPYVEALTNSRANFTVVRPLEAGEVPAGADAKVKEPTFPAPDAALGTLSDGAGAGGVDQRPGGDNMTHHAPPLPPGLVVREGGGSTVRQEPGGDNMAHAGAVAPGTATTGEERALAEEEATRAADAARAGETRPAVVITRVEPVVEASAGVETEIKTDPEADAEAQRLKALDRDGDGKAGGRINTGEILALNVDEVLERARTLAPDQRKALLAAEKKDKNRKGVVDGLTALDA